MKNAFILLVITALTAVFCSSPKGVTAPKGIQNSNSEEEERPDEGPQNTFILGIFLGESVNRAGDVVNHPGRNKAHIKVKEVLKAGSNYHGQFHAGDKLEVFFESGWSGDQSGQVPLNRGDTFKAELIETETRITIYHYDKI